MPVNTAVCRYCGQTWVLLSPQDEWEGHRCQAQRDSEQAEKLAENACRRCGSQLVKSANGGRVYPNRKTKPARADSRMRLECTGR
jgi:hypothetical protein